MTSTALPPPVPYSRLPDWQKVVIALGASLLLNLILFFFLGFFVLVHDRSGTKPLDRLKLTEVNFTAPTPTPTPDDLMAMQQPVATPTPMINSDDLHKTDTAPKDPTFQSDENLVAGSKDPGTGELPLPSQKGKNWEALEFSTHRYMPGVGEDAGAPPMMVLAPAPKVVPKQQNPQPTPPPMHVTPPPAATPEPTAMPTPVSTPIPTPASTPVPTPKEEIKRTSTTPVPAPTAPEAIYIPTPVPAVSAMPTPEMTNPTPVPTVRPPQTMAQTAPKPSQNPTNEQVRPKPPAYVPESNQTTIEGNISNRDQPGVDAIATPKGKYEKRISDAIRGRWDYYVDQRRDMITSGVVRINFYINQKGQVEDLKVISNDSNQVLASCSVQAIVESKFPPPPSELAPSLENGRYKVIFSFQIYPFQ